ncbi:MAG: hypothetical protein R6U10_01165 [Thermoplasmatota archaeon]
MAQLVCSNCKAVYRADGQRCPSCNAQGAQVYDFDQSDEYLKQETQRIITERQEAGLEGLVGDLAAVVINVQPERQRNAVEELLATTGLRYGEGYETDQYITHLLEAPAGADFLVRSRKQGNPFRRHNLHPKSEHLPDTRLETFIFETPDLQRYLDIQRERGVAFTTEQPIETPGSRYIQTPPSEYTGNALGFIEWKHGRRDFTPRNAASLDWQPEKPDRPYLGNVGELDHTATRVTAGQRDRAIIEFLELTNYHFDFAIYVKQFNSITNVARLSSDAFAMVFTSGIAPYKDDETSGPTERFIHNYGKRVHHMAFHTEHVQDTFAGLKEDGMDWLIELVGSPDEGLRQTFTAPSDNTLLVNEYIRRYGDFDGFFTRSNVTKLTEATTKQ